MDDCPSLHSSIVLSEPCNQHDQQRLSVALTHGHQHLDTDQSASPQMGHQSWKCPSLVFEDLEYLPQELHRQDYTWTRYLKASEYIYWTIVRDLNFPAIVGERVKENITTADITMDDGMWLHVMEIIESSSHISANEGDSLSSHWSLLYLFPKTIVVISSNSMRMMEFPSTDAPMNWTRLGCRKRAAMVISRVNIFW